MGWNVLPITVVLSEYPPTKIFEGFFLNAQTFREYWRGPPGLPMHPPPPKLQKFSGELQGVFPPLADRVGELCLPAKIELLFCPIPEQVEKKGQETRHTSYAKVHFKDGYLPVLRTQIFFGQT